MNFKLLALKPNDLMTLDGNSSIKQTQINLFENKQWTYFDIVLKVYLYLLSISQTTGNMTNDEIWSPTKNYSLAANADGTWRVKFGNIWHQPFKIPEDFILDSSYPPQILDDGTAVVFGMHMKCYTILLYSKDGNFEAEILGDRVSEMAGDVSSLPLLESVLSMDFMENAKRDLALLGQEVQQDSEIRSLSLTIDHRTGHLNITFE
jgi:hypothetical protein